MPKTLNGTLDTFSLADLLQWLEINGLSGRVTISRGEDRRTIDLKDGAIVFVSSFRPEERLGTYLASQGILSEQVVYEVLADSFLTGRSLTRLVLECGLLAREELATAVEQLALKILLDLFHWRGATFVFDPSVATEDYLRIQLSLRGQVLALEGARSLDDTARTRATDWRRMVETALAQRLGPGEKGREAAAILFAAWQGQALWGGDGFRIKDAAKRLASPQRM